MKTFVVILAVAGLASADIGLGYHYGPSKLQTSYGTPSYTVSSGGFNSGYTGQTLQGSGSNVYQTSPGFQNGYPSQVSTSGSGYLGSGYQKGNAGYQSGSGYQSGTGYQSGNVYQTGSGYQTGNNGYQPGGNYAGVSSSGNQYQSGGSFGAEQQGVHGLNQYQSSNQYQSKEANYQQYYNQVQHQPAQIFKHFYVHAAPEEPEAPRVRKPVVLPAPQKHYKIIFIKTPAPAVGSSQIIPVQQQNEEKTIVYVLVKKPEAAEDIVVPQIEQKPPSKPEVYFIKYKGKEDSQAVINNIVNEYNSGKESVNAVHSSGTLDSISSVKYTSQAGNVAEADHSGSGSEYETSVGSVGQSLGSGSVDSGSSGSFFQSSFGTSTVNYPSSTVGYQVSAAGPVQVNGSTGGYKSGNSGFSSTASSVGGYDQVNTVSSNQGIPHETYGPPKFRDN